VGSIWICDVGDDRELDLLELLGGEKLVVTLRVTSRKRHIFHRPGLEF
jgi:hypothetical protein